MAKKNAMTGVAALRHNTRQLEKAYGSDVLKRYLAKDARLGGVATREIRGGLSESESRRAATLGNRYIEQQKKKNPKPRNFF
jgi:hypothetical protein